MEEKTLRDRARKMRREMTPEEKHLYYDCLKKTPYTWKRQCVFTPYIVDFYCAAAKLAVEADGGQHYEQKGLEHDASRTDYLEKEYGLRVLHISNADIRKNIQGVYAYIMQAVAERIKGASSPACGKSLECPTMEK